MLRCRAVTERANAHLDRESGFWERGRMGLHLLACPPCRRYLAQLRATIEATRARHWAEAGTASQARALAAFTAQAAGDD